MMLSLLDKIVKALGWMTGIFQKGFAFLFCPLLCLRMRGCLANLYRVIESFMDRRLNVGGLNVGGLCSVDSFSLGGSLGREAAHAELL